MISIFTYQNTVFPNGVVSRTHNWPGNPSTSHVASHADDAFVGVNIPFVVQVFGSSYMTCYIGSNSYMTFGGGSSVYSNLGPGNPPYRGVHFGARDNSYSNVWSGSENGGATFRVRYNGHASTTSSGASILWDITFFRDEPNRMDFDIRNAGGSTGTTGVTSGSSYVYTFGYTANSGYTCRT